MALNIKNPITERLAHELAAASGTSLTEAVTVALRERLALVRGAARSRPLPDVSDLQALVRAQPDLDHRTADEILGYDDRGLPV